MKFIDVDSNISIIGLILRLNLFAFRNERSTNLHVIADYGIG